jgi:hypothetical protein
MFQFKNTKEQKAFNIDKFQRTELTLQNWTASHCLSSTTQSRYACSGYTLPLTISALNREQRKKSVNFQALGLLDLFVKWKSIPAMTGLIQEYTNVLWNFHWPMHNHHLQIIYMTILCNNHQTLIFCKPSWGVLSVISNGKRVSNWHQNDDDEGLEKVGSTSFLCLSIDRKNKNKTI